MFIPRDTVRVIIQDSSRVRVTYKVRVATIVRIVGETFTVGVKMRVGVGAAAIIRVAKSESQQSNGYSHKIMATVRVGSTVVVGARVTVTESQ